MAPWRSSSTNEGQNSCEKTKNSTSPRARTSCISNPPPTIVKLIQRQGHVVQWGGSVIKCPAGWTAAIFCAAGADITLLNVKWWNDVNVNLNGVVMWNVKLVRE